MDAAALLLGVFCSGMIVGIMVRDYQNFVRTSHREGGRHE